MFNILGQSDPLNIDIRPQNNLLFFLLNVPHFFIRFYIVLANIIIEMDSKPIPIVHAIVIVSQSDGLYAIL